MMNRNSTLYLSPPQPKVNNLLDNLHLTLGEFLFYSRESFSKNIVGYFIFVKVGNSLLNGH